MIYLYALTDERPQGFHHLGLDDAPVHSMTCSGLHLVHSQHPDNFEAIVTPTALWTHESVVDELLETGAVVPFRFGTTVPDKVWAASIVASHAARLRETLEELRGRVELAVRIGLPDRPADPSDVLVTLASLAAASRNAHADDDNVIRASYLVARDQVGYFASVVRDLQDDHPELAVSCTGPWAPYSFAIEAGL